VGRRGGEVELRACDDVDRLRTVSLASTGDEEVEEGRLKGLIADRCFSGRMMLVLLVPSSLQFSPP
jgi:hypothetical protein